VKQVDFETWLHCPGMPPVAIIHDQSLITAVKDTVEQYQWPFANYYLSRYWQMDDWDVE
jgi:hypothetical protein